MIVAEIAFMVRQWLEDKGTYPTYLIMPNKFKKSFLLETDEICWATLAIPDKGPMRFMNMTIIFTRSDIMMVGELISNERRR